MRVRRRMASLALVVAAVLTVSAGCAATSEPEAESAGTLDLVQVPGDADTLAQASGLVAPGGVIEIGEGVWAEQLLVSTPDVTVRGVDRNETIIDGEGLRPYGVVGIADGVRIENLTVTGATFYGVLVTGLHDEAGPAAHGAGAYEPFDPEAFPPLQRFAIEGVTAHNNGLYGIYAFNAQHGVIRESYASGSADSGFYVGQCETCNILVERNVAERNAVGFENANASGLTVVGNRFSDNRVGMTFLSNYVEAFSPQRDNEVAGNLVSDNVSTDSPSQADGGFGIGIGVSGGVDDLFVNNRVTGNPRAGVLISNTEDLATIGLSVQQTDFAENGVDIANVSADRAPATGTCVSGSFSALPEALQDAALACSDTPDPAASSADLPHVEAPPGVSFLQVAAPTDQPQFSSNAGMLPAEIEMPDASTYPVPATDFLADRTGTR
ncbi:right-handed parallel beta-helix repeat-containing protein [Microbacterium sp. NPDC076911]|uniref:right-handed parallel beta-helix repeat-containing protein n=1 Tax=Microbacterium sp. NPDC076911 TaxID=3154958 RepID=UPI00341FA57E